MAPLDTPVRDHIRSADRVEILHRWRSAVWPLWGLGMRPRSIACQ